MRKFQFGMNWIAFILAFMAFIPLILYWKISGQAEH